MRNARTVAEPFIAQLAFAEGLRWRGDELWYSDFHLREVRAASAGGDSRVVCQVPDDRPSGLGWLPNGDLLIVAMMTRRLLRWSEDSMFPYANLAPVATYDANDLLVDPLGRAYVSHFGGAVHAERTADGRFRLLNQPTAARLVLVSADGVVTTASETPLLFPNGMALTDGGRRFLVAETVARRISVFDVEPDGSLANYRIFANVDGYPDALSVDAAGGVWFADTERKGCFRVMEGGEETDAIFTENMCFGCALGGHDGRDLYLATSERRSPAELLAERPGRIDRARVQIPLATGG